MGCDIHLVLEYKTSVGWVGLHDFPWLTNDNGHLHVRNGPSTFLSSWKVSTRNYELFANLAGVRGEGPEPKGLPSDASALTTMHSQNWGEDGHSHSHCSVQEFADCYLRSQSEEYRLAYIKERIIKSEDPSNELACQLFGIDDLNNLSSYRVVFWFDN